MALFGSLFKSKAEKEFLGDAVTCARCGKQYYEIKGQRMPFELIGKYDDETAAKCQSCGKVYCSQSFAGLSCKMRGCSCGGHSFVIEHYAIKRGR